MDERKLYWVARNRGKPERTRNAGGLVTDLAGPLERRHEALAAAARLVGPIVDDEFRSHCRIGEVADDGVVIHVDNAAFVMPLRARCSAAALAALRGDRAFSRIRHIRFEFGRDGAALTV